MHVWGHACVVVALCPILNIFIASEASSVTNFANFRFLVYIFIGERSEPHTYRTVGKNLRHIYIYVFYIYIYIYTSVRRATCGVTRVLLLHFALY